MLLVPCSIGYVSGVVLHMVPGTCRSGWPWFGDEVEIIMDAQPLVSRKAAPDASAVGNATQWQVVVNTIKSTYGGFGKGT